MSSGGGTTSSDTDSLLSAERDLFSSLTGPQVEADWSDEDDGGEQEHLLQRRKGKLGSFQGVFAPITLCMMSSLMFLRMGYVVSNAGITGTALMLIIAYLILLCTAFSISALVTNGAVSGGGVYFMISRTLGPEFGGAIGILFYFANIASSAFYSTGKLH